MQVEILGRKFDVADEPKDFWGWVGEGRYDPEWYGLQKFLRPEHTFLDVGAWVGSHSLFASTIAHRVEAVEPDPVAFQILSQNIKGLNISACHGAIAGHRGTITLGSGLLGASTTRANPEAGGGIGAWEEGQQFDAPCTTLRQFVDTQELMGSLFIKIDIEGAEEQILADLDFFAERKPDLYIEMHPWWWHGAGAMWQQVGKLIALYKDAFNLRMQRVTQTDYPDKLLLIGEK